MDHQPARVPARLAYAAVLRSDQQQRQGRLVQELRRDSCDHPLPLRQEHAAGRLRRSAGQDRPGARAGSCSSRRAAWPATSTGRTRTADIDAGRPDCAVANPAYKLDATLTYDPARLPGGRPRPRPGRFRPQPFQHRGQVPVQAPGTQMAGQLDRRPRELSHEELDAQPSALDAQDAADIASWILSVPGEWPVKVEVPAVDSKEVRDGRRRARQALRDQERQLQESRRQDRRQVTLSEVDEFVEKELKLDDKLLYLGEKTISRLGCFGCHTIPGFENAKPIGTALNDWGIKSPARLDYGHIAEYLVRSRASGRRQRQPRRDRSVLSRARSSHETRIGFLYQKLHRPRSFDYLKKSEKYKTWDDRLRMPQFAWANKPEAVEEVMTFVLGLTNEKIPAEISPQDAYHPGAHRGRPGLEARQPVQLRRLPRARYAQVHDPCGNQGGRCVHRLQDQPPLVVHRAEQRLHRRAVSTT